MTHRPKHHKPRHPRVNLTSWARLFLKGETEGRSATVVDISRGGMGVYAKWDIAATTGVEIELKFFDAEKNVWIEKVRGWVVRCEKVGSVYFVGIRFSEGVDSSKNPRLSAAIADLEEK